MPARRARKSPKSPAAASRLGIDFGTTRTVVALEDRGNYPLVSFHDERGGAWTEWFPSLVAAVDGSLHFGHAARHAAERADAWVLSSIKRALASAAPDETLDVPGVGPVAIAEILSGFLRALRAALADGTASVTIPADAPVEATISVPANANSNQRFLTVAAFESASFRVTQVLNEPSAAGVEYAQRYLASARAPKTRDFLAVYDLGGGTFDAAAIRIADMRHDVVASEGVERLGGDDFDAELLALVLEQMPDATLDGPARARLLDECRERKEALNPNTRKILVEASRAIDGAPDVIVEAQAFYDRCAPLVERTVDCLELVLARLDGDGDESPAASASSAVPAASAAPGSLPPSVATVYVVGGASTFPPVLRILKERYGRRVQRSPYPHAAVALGLAIAGNPDERYFVRETLTRHFGVWREADAGARVVFDSIFAKDSALEGDGDAELRATRRYRPAHNIGRFRFLECSSLDADGEPARDLAIWDEIVFAFDPALRQRADVPELPIRRSDRSDDAATIVEEYVCDSSGIVSVTVRDEANGYERSYQLGGNLGVRRP